MPALFAVSVLVYAGVVVWAALALPETVPAHFGVDGEVTASTTRGTWVVTATLTGAGTAAVLALCLRLARHPDRPWMNVPHPRYWKRPEHVDELRGMLREDLGRLGAATMLLLAGVFALAVPAARMPEPSISPWGDVLLLAYVVVTVGYVVWMYVRRYAVPHGADA